MKKKLLISIVVLLGVVGLYLGIKPDFNLEFYDPLVFEYGQKISDQEIIKWSSHSVECINCIDSFKVGKQTVKYRMHEGVFHEEFENEVMIEDRQAPVIEFNKSSITISYGQSFDVKRNIKRVYDIVDGSLDYQIEGQVDTHKPGQYKVVVKAVDRHGLTAEKSFDVIVLKQQSQETMALTPQRPLNGKVICINAGHQGRGNSALEPIGPGSSKKKAKVSSGATGVSSRIPESQTTLKVALKLQKELQRRGYKVIMTRTSQNVDLSNKERAVIGNQASATISLHCDGGSSSARGAHTIAIKKDNPYCGSLYSESSLFARKVIDAYSKVTGIKNRGVSYRNDLTGLNYSKVPAIYLEMGFISHPSEDQMLNSDSFQNQMVKGIAEGIDSYFKH